MLYAMHDHTHALRRVPTVRALLAFLAAILAGPMVSEIATPFSRILVAGGGPKLGPAVAYLFFAIWIISAQAGFLVTLLAGPRAKSAFVLWPFLMCVGLLLSDCFASESLIKLEKTIIGFSTMIYPAFIGCLLPALWYWMKSYLNEPAPRSHRSPLFLGAIAFAAGLASYAIIRLIGIAVMNSPQDSIIVSLIVGTLPMLAAWVAFLISNAGGSQQIRWLPLWPLITVVGFLGPILVGVIISGSSLGTIITDLPGVLAMQMLAAGLIGSALPLIWFIPWKKLGIAWPSR